MLSGNVNKKTLALVLRRLWTRGKRMLPGNWQRIKIETKKVLLQVAF